MGRFPQNKYNLGSMKALVDKGLTTISPNSPKNIYKNLYVSLAASKINSAATTMTR